MKKMVSLIALMLAVSAGSAFAGQLSATGGTNTDGTGGTVTGSTDTAAAGTAILGRLSKGVQIGAKFTNSQYAVTTKSLQGSKIFGVAYDSTIIYSKDSTAGANVVAPATSTAVGTFDQTGWTQM